MNSGKRHADDDDEEDDGPFEFVVIGDLPEGESDLCDKLLSVPEGGECTLYFDSPGGSAYAAMSLMTLLTIRNIHATGIVTGQCSSAALWPFAACQRRFVTPYSVLFFHPMRWESEEQVNQAEAREWTRHFGVLEQDMDRLLAMYLKMDEEKLAGWMSPGRYVSGRELVEAGLAELIDIDAQIRKRINRK